MFLYYVLSNIVLIILCTIWYVNIKKTKLCQTAFSNVQLPICIIDYKGKITWQNKLFEQEFELDYNTEFKQEFEVKHILSQMQTFKNNTAWVIKHTKIGKNAYIIFQPLKKEMVNWWSSIPFPVGILNEKNEIEDHNNSFKKIFNQKAIGKHITEFAPQFNEQEAQKIKGQELVWHYKNGILPIITWVKPYNDKKLLILENRAEFIQLKNKAQEAEHLQIMGQLASSIIHDFNNLLTAINGFSEALEITLPDNEMLVEIKRNTNQAANLAKELLNFVKNKPQETQTCKLNEFLKSRQSMLQKLLGSHIKLEVTANYDGYVEISPTQLEQIILNMVLNSKDAMLGEDYETKTNMLKIHSLSIIQHKKILPSKTKIRNTMLEAGQYFVLQITDTGKGIPQENINKIFNPFFSTKTKGTGLGLASCMRIIEHAGGTIDLATSPMGTKFLIYIPLLNEKQNHIQPLKEIEKAKPTNNEKHILQLIKNDQKTIVLAEDEEVIRNLASKILAHENFKVHSFENGKDAIEFFKTTKEHIDLLITDAVLPGIDGIELTAQAQKIQPTINTLIISGYSQADLMPNIKTKVEKIEQVKYLGKPFTLKTLKEVVSSLTEK